MTKTFSQKKSGNIIQHERIDGGALIPHHGDNKNEQPQCECKHIDTTSVTVATY